jgi:hypothetical protein
MVFFRVIAVNERSLAFMQSSGLIFKYKVNRPLTDDERAHQLKQKQRIEVEPIYQLSVIKANSTYLEVVDKYFDYKGYWTMGMLIILIVLFGFLILFLFDTVTDTHNRMWIALLEFSVLSAPLFYLGTKTLLLESFTYTHYPVRFNRKTRMVHVFMVDGRQLSVPWDDVFFYLSAGVQNEKDWWDLRGHILDKDGKTVLDTFAMMRSHPGKKAIEIMTQQWEFIRRYMEDDQTKIIEMIEVCMPVDGKRETWNVAWQYEYGKISGLAITFMALPLAIIQLPFRMLAMHSSKLPKWNAAIEAANVIETNDPYIKDSRINPEGVR